MQILKQCRSQSELVTLIWGPDSAEFSLKAAGSGSPPKAALISKAS